jgi:hypothetical protein
MIEAAAAFVAWAGASALVLSDARRGLAVGTALAAFGLAIASLPAAGWPGAAALLVGGAAAGVRRNAAGPPGWSVMPAGSTPRLVLCVAGGLVALWVGAAVMTGPEGGLRFSVLAVLGLAGSRVLSSDDPWVVQSAFAVVALAVGASAGLVTGTPGVWPYVAAALVAAAAAWIPHRTPRAA